MAEVKATPKVTTQGAVQSVNNQGPTVGDELINRSPYIEDKEAFTKGLNAISDELGVSRDFLPIIMMTEANLKPSANNGNCGGLIQFCNEFGGAAELGIDAHVISNMSAVEQLPLIRQYLSNKKIPKGADLATTYLAILTPALVGASRTEELGISGQAQHLYGPDGRMTKETLEHGLLAHAGVDGGKLVGASPSGDGTFTPISKGSSNSTPASLGTNGGAIIIGTYTRDCSKTPPWDWTMQMGKIYRGCALRITTLGIKSGTSTTPMQGAMTTTTTKASMGKATLVSNVTPPKPGSLVYPVPGVSINSPMGMRWGRMHNGVDMAADFGTPILAAMDGVITRVDFDPGGYGNYITIKHNDGSISETLYGHMESTSVTVGQEVKAGQPIGAMGSTGGSTGPHLHFEVRDNNDQRIDPASVLPPP